MFSLLKFQKKDCTNRRMKGILIFLQPDNHSYTALDSRLCVTGFHLLCLLLYIYCTMSSEKLQAFFQVFSKIFFRFFQKFFPIDFLDRYLYTDNICMQFRDGVAGMSNLKKSFLGGYSKTSVDALVEELNQQIAGLKDRESSLTAAMAQKDADIAQLSAKADSLTAETEVLTAENRTLRDEVNHNRSVFENVAKIYERAYGAGHDIVLDSKTISEQMLSRMNRLFSAAADNTDKTIARQKALSQEIRSLYGKLHTLMDELSDNTDALFAGAENYMAVFEDLQDIRTDTEKQAEMHLDAFRDYAAEFLTAQENRKAETTPAPAAETEETAAPVVSETTEEPVARPHPPVMTIVPKNAPEQEAPAAVQEPDIPGTPEEPAAAAQETEATPQPAKSLPSKEQKNTITAEFTQFGRKSRVSSSDRDELIRKALLKNGGMGS